MKWEKGRQEGTEYKKLCLYSFKIWKWGFDAYILKYKENTVLNTHTDPVKNGKHYRLNIGWGVANFCCKYYDQIIGYRIGKLTFTAFRPDINPHSLYVFENTIKLSLGFVKYE